MDLGLLVLRLLAGLSLAAHGAQKLFGWFGGYGLAGTGGFMEQLGFRPGRKAAFMAGAAETLGGLLLALGAATPVAAAMIVGVMLVAIVTVHAAKGYFAQNGGYELPLLLAVIAVSLALTGPGRFSVDALLGTTFSGLAWGLGALVVGVAGAGLRLASRRVAPTAQPEARAA